MLEYSYDKWGTLPASLHLFYELFTLIDKPKKVVECEFNK